MCPSSSAFRILMAFSTIALSMALVAGAQTAESAPPADATRDAVKTVRPTVVSDEVRSWTPSGPEAENVSRWRDVEIDPSLYRPMPLPKPKPRDPNQPRTPAGNMVSFDMVSRVERFIESNDLWPETLPEGGLPSRRGEETFRGEPYPGPDSMPKDFGGLSLVTDVTGWPYRAAVKLFIQARDTGGTLHYFECSGAIIDPMHVITAGHCAYFHEDDDGNEYNDWAEQIVVSPGYYDGYQPYGNAQVVDFHSWEGWTVHENFDHDIALLDLAEPIGALTGSLGLNWATDCDWFEEGTWRHVGWPAETPYNGEFPYTHTGAFDRCDWIGNEITFYSESYGGQSGSGAIRNHNVFAILSNGNALLTHDVRIDDTKWGHMRDWILDDTPVSYDLMPMDVHALPTTIESGSSLSDFDYMVHNYSTDTFVSTLSTSVRLSTNDNISTADPEIQTHSLFTTIEAKSSLRIEALGPTIPADTPTGTYYVGVILDIIDHNTGNNDSDGDDACEIQVICPNQAGVTLVSPASGSTCGALDPILDWSSAPNAETYELQVGTSCGSGTIYTTSASQMQVTLQTETTYYWRVRAQNPCGDWSSWTLCRFFTTGGDAPGLVPLTWPANQENCVPTSPWLDWNQGPGAVDYEVQLGLWCDVGTIYFAPSTYFGATDLDPDTAYGWRVRGLDACGNPGPWSPCRYFRTEPLVPDEVTLVDPSDDETCVSLNPTLDWTSDPWADSYEIRVSFSCLSGTVYTSTSSQITLSGLLPDRGYSWRVRARNSCDEWSDWSTCQQFRTEYAMPDPPVVTAPSDGTGCAGSNVMLTWDAVPNAVTYFPRVGTSCDAGTVYATTETSIEITDLTPGTTYYWRIRTKDTCGTMGTWSACYSFTVDGNPPSKPTNLTANPPAGAWTNDPLIDLRWTQGGDNCDLLVGASYIFTEDPRQVPDTVRETLASQITSPKLPNGDLMRFHVRSVDSAGNGSQMAAIGPFWIDTKTPTVLLMSPDGGESWHEGETHTIEWTASDALSGLQSIELRYSTDGGATYPNLIANPATTASSYDWVIPAENSDQVQVRIRVRDRASNQKYDWSGDFTLAPPAVGVPDSPPVTATRLLPNHPNPFNPETTIQYSLLRGGHVKLAIYNVQGQLVSTLVDRFQEGPAWHEVSWNGTKGHGGSVASGVYFYQLVSGSVVETKRMTLVR